MPLGKEESRYLRYSAYGFLIKSPAEWKMGKPENQGCKKCRNRVHHLRQIQTLGFQLCFLGFVNFYEGDVGGVEDSRSGHI
jgi:hypothetical protein